MGNWWGGRWKVKVPHSTGPSNTLRCWNRNARGLQIWPGNGGGRRKVGRRPPPYTHDRPMMITMVMPEHRTHHRNTGTPEHRRLLRKLLRGLVASRLHRAAARSSRQLFVEQLQAQPARSPSAARAQLKRHPSASSSARPLRAPGLLVVASPARDATALTSASHLSRLDLRD